MAIQNTKILRGGKEISETYREATIMQEFGASFQFFFFIKKYKFFKTE